MQNTIRVATAPKGHLDQGDDEMADRIEEIQEAGRQRLLARRAWQESEEYQSLCNQYQLEVDRMVSAGMNYWQKIIQNQKDFRAKAVEFSYYVSGNIHRGFFCPSPVADLILGQTNRGHEAKETEITKARWRFSYDESKHMIYVDCMQNKRVLNTEFLFWEDSVRWGVLISQDGVLEKVTRELYDQDKLIEYSQATLYPDENGFFCECLRTERYFRDALGLHSCEEIVFQPFIHELERRRYDFEREDGYLKSFTRIDYATIAVDGETPKMKYSVRVQRKAN